MPFKSHQEAYELDRSDNSPFLDHNGHAEHDLDHNERVQFEHEHDHDSASDISEINQADPLRNTKRRYTDDASQPLRSVFDTEKNVSFAQQPMVWLDDQRRRGSWQRLLIPSAFCCMLGGLFMSTLLLLLAVGVLWGLRIGRVTSDGQSEPWYPAPNGGTIDPWKDSYKKAAEMVGNMTLIEKVNVTTGTGWSMGMCVGNTGPVDRLGFPSLCLQDGPLGLRFVDNATAWPAGITVGATWNKELMYQRGQAHGFEARKKGVNVLLGPSMGPIGRLPAGGRNWEGFGSDPVLQAVGASQSIRGIQSAGVMATAKHFVGNEQEHFRQADAWGLPNAISSNIDDRTLHEVYAWPFAESVRAGVASVMCSYNQVNNSYACQNSKLMNGILKDELGFQGFIQSDWLAQRSGVASALAGLDMSMPGDGLGWQDGDSLWGGELTKSVLNGSVPMERLNDMVLRVVAGWYQLKQDNSTNWHNGTLSSSATFSSWTNARIGKVYEGASNSDEEAVVNQFVQVRNTTEGGDHDLLARKIAAEGIVMVKNDDNVLPLHRNASGVHSSRYGKSLGDKVKVAIFGEDAFPNPRGPNACVDRGCNDHTLAVGWGSGASEFPHLIAPFDALNATFDHSKWEVTASNHQAAKHAGELAEEQDLCIVFVNSDAGEGYLSWGHIRGDRNDLLSQNHGDALVAEVAKKCGNSHESHGSAANTIVVFHTVGPIIVEKWIDMPGVKSVLIAHLPGQESGKALADVMFGDVNPSGKLPYTIAKDEDDFGPDSKILTIPHNLVPQQNFTEGLYIDYRYLDKHSISPRYPFGHGLSYTTFELSDIEIEDLGIEGDLPAPRPVPSVEPPKLDTTIPDPSSAVWPGGFRKLKKFIYPYIDSASDAKPKGSPKFPYDPARPHALSQAGGAQGGNPDLYTPAISITASLTNTGNVTGKAVVQMYLSYVSEVKDMDGKVVDMPVKVLRGFEKYEVDAGESEDVKFELTRKDLSYWDVKRQNWVVPKAEMEVQLGFSSADLPLKEAFTAL